MDSLWSVQKYEDAHLQLEMAKTRASAQEANANTVNTNPDGNGTEQMKRLMSCSSHQEANANTVKQIHPHNKTKHTKNITQGYAEQFLRFVGHIATDANVLRWQYGKPKITHTHTKQKTKTIL